MLSTSRADLEARNFLAATASGFFEDFAISGAIMEYRRKPYQTRPPPARPKNRIHSVKQKSNAANIKRADERQTKMNWLLYGYFLRIILQKKT